MGQHANDTIVQRCFALVSSATCVCPALHVSRSILIIVTVLFVSDFSLSFVVTTSFLNRSSGPVGGFTLVRLVDSRADSRSHVERDVTFQGSAGSGERDATGW